VLQQVGLFFFRLIDDQQVPALHLLQQGLDRGHAKARAAVLMLHHAVTAAGVGYRSARNGGRWSVTPEPHSLTTFATGHPRAAQKAATRSAWPSRCLRFSAEETRAETATCCGRTACGMGGTATITVPEGNR